MTEVQKQIEELTSQIVQAAKAEDGYLVCKIGDKINHLREIVELEKELVQAAKDGDTVSAYTLGNKINDIRELIEKEDKRQEDLGLPVACIKG